MSTVYVCSIRCDGVGCDESISNTAEASCMLAVKEHARRARWVFRGSHRHGGEGAHFCPDCAEQL